MKPNTDIFDNQRSNIEKSQQTLQPQRLLRLIVTITTIIGNSITFTVNGNEVIIHVNFLKTYKLLNGNVKLNKIIKLPFLYLYGNCN